ncbi:hypothetical protein BYT27DRAFT_7082006 [Phlegmacium glaucopus]|nr:hypothetical protein BYT27DRAFT_7082006 [Phlegmacium glaucopus]
MASSHEKAQWSDWEITGLVDYLYEHKSEMGDTGMFKMSTFNAVADSISDLLTDGPPKTGKMCKTKWQSLKATYSTIQKYQETSGVHWDNATGASIQTNAEANVWKEHIKIKVCYQFVL